MVKTIAGEHHWDLEKVASLYLDGEDMEGLLFWYEDVKDTIERMKRAAKSK